MRQQPQLGFSLANRTIISRISFISPGRPTRCLAYVHFAAINCLCQRKTVSGVTIVATSDRTR